MLELEKRAYGPDSTQEEIEMLRSRVNIFDTNVICYQEVFVMSTFQIEVMTQKVNELIVPGEEYYMIINLSKAQRPNAEQRHKIKECFSKFTDAIIYTSIYTESNLLNNIAAKFILGSIGFSINSVHATREKSLNSIKKEKEKRAKK